jgi:hypothetical protein
MPDAPRVPRGEQVAYYSPWQTDTWQCPCGWTGTGKDAAWEMFDALLQVDCPKCDKRLCLVIYPSPAEERAAAKAGNEEAKRAVDQAKNRGQREEKFKTTKLVRAAQLPMLKGVDALDLLLECEEIDGDTLFVLSYDGQRLHAEQAWWESNSPLRRYCRYAAQRYGDRLKTFTIGSGASMWLAGDSLTLYYEQAEILKEFGLVEKAKETSA